MKLVLGTVQFGVNYGITNNAGQVKSKAVIDILEHARISNISMLDTASAYGNSESVLGSLATQDFMLISKVPTVATLKTSIHDCINQSLTNLKRKSIYGVMLHDEADLLSSKKPYDELIIAKKNKLVKKIGCSFYTVNALKKAFEMNYQLDLIQIPLNCLDQRFLESGVLDEAKKRGIEIHCRSLFLQGLLLDSSANLPNKLKPFKSVLDKFFDFCKIYDLTPLETTLKFLQQADMVDYGVVGCISQLQLSEITAAYKNVQNLQKYVDFRRLSSVNDILLNPTLWN
ncbi:MAG: hypothetical protein HAW67_02015 [Endozoicomonadaceae bacterium]|nr:hypothetical protein [Endozoicomonadaceae bacterium]